jgi:hypothetical protein
MIYKNKSSFVIGTVELGNGIGEKMGIVFRHIRPIEY